MWFNVFLLTFSYTGFKEQYVGCYKNRYIFFTLDLKS